MTEQMPPSPERITPAVRRWLEGESLRWTRDGLITGDQSRAILGRYESAAALQRRRSRRLFVVLTGLAVLMASAGLLLLIGHNWEEIPRAAKVGLIVSAVAAAFAAASASYARGRAASGEVLAFLGTLLYGNAIWLLAQVFHIRAHYPNGVLWWWIGAVVTAHALRSVAIGVEAAILLTVWVGMESVSFADPGYGFWAGLLLLLALAWRLGSPLLAVLGALSLPAWLLFAASNSWGMPGQSCILSLLAGCAVFATGSFWRAGGIEEAWRRTGLLIVLVSMIPLTFTDYHVIRTYWRDPALAQGIAAGLGLVGCAVAGWIDQRRRKRGIPTAMPIVAAAGTAALLAPLLVDQPREEGAGLALAVLFSATSVLVAIGEIQRGIGRDEGRSFFTGVLYLMIFVLVRWFDLIGDMISSAAIFFIAAIVLWATARYWQGRRREGAAPGEPAHG